MIVILIFGASVISPREVIEVVFQDCFLDMQEQESSDIAEENQVQNQTPCQSMPRSKLLRLCVQKMMRIVISNSSNLFSK
jgi:hypothetical protein